MFRCGYLIIFLFLFLRTGVSMAQQGLITGRDITGLWKGVLHNDTTGRDLPYEVAISEYKGKLSGFSHTFFIQDNIEYYGIIKVKVRKRDDKIIIEDQEQIANNYPKPPAKGIRKLSILKLEIQDSVMILAGLFTTNSSKEYHSISGNIRVKRKNDFRQSALVTHLEELGLEKELSFIEPEIRTGAKADSIESPFTKIKVKKIDKPVKEPPPVITKTEPPLKIPEPVIVLPGADVDKRKIETIQSVYYKSDSLVLTLYDNGEVDGDTVSVLMNGKVIMPMVGLSTKAVRKTIYITKETPDSIQLIMYAENLGSIPPNTGLLVVHDGEVIYEIRFSGDMQKNAAILFRRKK